MKYSPTIYARAFLESLGDTSADHDKILKRFIKTVAKHGDLSRVDRIVEEIESQYVTDKGGRVIKLEFARAQSDETVNRLKKEFKKDDIVSASINPSLVAGVRITIDGQYELDRTMRRKLNRLFK